MGAVRDALAPMITMVLYVAYGVMAAFGILFCILGGYYFSEIESSDSGIAAAVGICGLFMIAIAGIAIFAANTANKIIMGVVLIIDIALFFALVSACIIGYILAMSVEDPIEEAVVKVYEPTSYKINQWSTVLKSLEGKDSLAGPATCKTLHDALKFAKKRSEGYTGPANPCQPNLFNAKCLASATTKLTEVLYTNVNQTQESCALACARRVKGYSVVGVQGQKCSCGSMPTGNSVSGMCKDATYSSDNNCGHQDCGNSSYVYVIPYSCGTGDLPPPPSTVFKDNEEKTFAGNCTLTDIHLGHTVAKGCVQCWKDFELYLIDKIKANLWPVTFFAISLLVITIAAMILNAYVMETGASMEDEDDEEGESNGIPLKIPGLVLAGIEALFGLLLLIFGIVANSELTDDATCAAGDVECTNFAVIMVCVMGAIFFVAGIVHVVSLVLGGTIGRLMLRIVNLIYMVMTLLLLVFTLFFALIAGAIDSINTEYDLNFAEIRKSVEKAKPGYCTLANGNPMSDYECKHQIMNDTKGDLRVLAVILSIANMGMLVVLYITLQAVIMWHGGVAQDDGEDDY